MVVLAVDTTMPAGSLALSENGKLLECRVGDAERTHGERLPGDIVSLLSDNGTTLKKVDRYAICSGPGSFTGIRVGLATIQAFGLAYGRPIVSVPTLEALAYAALARPVAAKGPRRVGTVMTAHRGEIFAAVYELSSPGQYVWEAGTECPPLVEVIAPTVEKPEVVLSAWRDVLNKESSQIIGATETNLTTTVKRIVGAKISLIEQQPPLAEIATRIAGLKDSADLVRAHAIRPVYVRRPYAEIARDRRQNLKES